MNLIKQIWVLKNLNKNVKVYKQESELIVENKSSLSSKLICLCFKKLPGNFSKISFTGEIIKGSSCSLNIYSTSMQKLYGLTLNSESLVENSDRFIFVLSVEANTVVKIIDLKIEELNSIEQFLESSNLSNFLIISPSYPSSENKYLSGFVHSRLKAYKKAGIKFTLVCAFNYNHYSKYTFEGIEVLKVPFEGLRILLRIHNFNKIAVHFFDWRYARILDSSFLLDKKLYFWIHGPETLYWDWPYFTSPYFAELEEISTENEKIFKESDSIIKRYNQKINVKWIFVSEWIKKRSEELIGIKFENSLVIPNYVDESNFSYSLKDRELRKKIFILRRYDDISKYAVDISVRTIKALSKKKFFKQLEFNIYGSGSAFEKLFSPLFNFENVHFHREFLTHADIAKIHKENGIALFPTRYDAQGVSMCEAAMSGLAVISSNNDAIREFIPDLGNLIKTEDHHAYAEEIEKIYRNEKYFFNLSESCHQKVMEKCSFDKTVGKEIEMFLNDEHNKESGNETHSSGVRKKTLSIIVPSYNVEGYLNKCVESLLNHSEKENIEVIIINDGSTDNTLMVAREIEKYWNSLGTNLVRVIDKENGGHGSTINVGIQESSGRYLRIVDSDDWVNSYDLERLIRILKTEEADLVLTNYSEDRVGEDRLIKRCLYNFLSEGVKYNFEELCDGSDYGFNQWGPILATSNFKTEILKELKFKLTEKSPYVDMEFNMYSIIPVQSIVYYNLDIYRYFIGRSGQTISKESYKRNFLKHENILFKMIDFVENNELIPPYKKEYIVSRLIEPMISAQYLIVKDYFRSPRKFIEFDRKLKKHSLLYNSKAVQKLDIILGRKSMGISVIFDGFLDKITRKGLLNTIAVKIKILFK